MKLKMTSQGREVGKQKKAHREEEGPFGVPLDYWPKERVRMSIRFSDGQPCLLSDEFYDAYPPDSYPEIESKRNRPHVMVLVQSDTGSWFAVPLRSNTRHRFCFKTVGNGGLDYTKAIPLLDDSFVDMDRKAMVRQSDWPIIQSDRRRIRIGMRNYIEQHKRAKKNPANKMYKNLIRFFTPQYFEDELGLNG